MRVVSGACVWRVRCDGDDRSPRIVSVLRARVVDATCKIKFSLSESNLASTVWVEGVEVFYWVSQFPPYASSPSGSYCVVEYVLVSL